jgi:hypothetical protein
MTHCGHGANCLDGERWIREGRTLPREANGAVANLVVVHRQL